MNKQDFDRSNPTATSTPSSTGPITDAGKAISSRNATRHGCCSTSILILPGEDIEAFHSLEAIWIEAYEADSTEEPLLHLVHLLAEADWFLQRATRAVAQVEADIYATLPNPSEWTEDQHKKLTRFLRYQTTRTNLFVKARKAIEDFERHRDQEEMRDQHIKHKDERLEMAKQRLEVYKESHPPVLTLEQEMDQLREKAIEMGYINEDGSSTGKREAEDAALHS